MADITITPNDTLELTYSVSNYTNELDEILNINILTESDEENTKSDITNNINDVDVFYWQPSENDVGGEYEFELSNNTSITVEIIDMPDSVVLDDWNDNSLTSNRRTFSDLEPSIETNEDGLYSVEYRPEWTVDSGSPSNDNGRLFLPNATSNGHQRIQHNISELNIDITNIEWELEVERTSGSNNSAEFGLMLDSESSGAVFFNYDLNNDDDARFRYFDGSTMNSFGETVVMASGSKSGTNHWRIVKEGDQWSVYLDGELAFEDTLSIDIDFNGVYFSNGEWLDGDTQNFDADIWIDDFYANPY